MLDRGVKQLMTIKLFETERIDAKSMVHIAYRLTQVITFALLFSTTAAILVCDLVLSANPRAAGDSTAFLLGLLVVVVSYFGLITAIGSLTTRLTMHSPSTLYRRAALILSEDRKYDRYLDTVYISLVTWLIFGVFNSTAAIAGLERVLPSLTTIALLFPISLFAALVLAQPKATKNRVAKLCDRLNRELTGISGVDMNQANNLLTLLILQGKYAEADELSQKLMSLAEQSPELIR